MDAAMQPFEDKAGERNNVLVPASRKACAEESRRTSAAETEVESGLSEIDVGDQDLPEENELNISFQSLSKTKLGDNFLDFSGHSSSGTTTPHEDEKGAGRRPRENVLGHRFDLVQPCELALWLMDDDKRSHILVVDARGRDWVGAHIPSSINLRTSEICSHPESLTHRCLRDQVDHIIFTCMYSVLRAKKCALAVQRAQDEAFKAGLQAHRIRISLLAGGMHGWVNYWMSNGMSMESPPNPYIQGFDASCWCDGGPSQGGLVHVMDALWSQGGQQALSNALLDELSALAALSSPSQRISPEPKQDAATGAGTASVIKEAEEGKVVGSIAAGSAQYFPVVEEVSCDELQQTPPGSLAPSGSERELRWVATQSCSERAET